MLDGVDEYLLELKDVAFLSFQGFRLELKCFLLFVLYFKGFVEFEFGPVLIVKCIGKYVDVGIKTGIRIRIQHQGRFRHNRGKCDFTSRVVEHDFVDFIGLDVGFDG